MLTQSFIGPSLEGMTIGFLGFGSIAQILARRLLSFSPKKIVYTTSKPKPFDLDADAFAMLAQDPLLSAYHAENKPLPVDFVNEPDRAKMVAEVDMLVVLVNYSDSTHHIVNAELLAKMNPSAYIINVGRGASIDTDALVSALHKGGLAGAGLDVVEDEPNVGKDHPLLAPDLDDKVVLLPHIGSATIESRHAMADTASMNVLGALGVRPDKPDQMPDEYKLS